MNNRGSRQRNSHVDIGAGLKNDHYSALAKLLELVRRNKDIDRYDIQRILSGGYSSSGQWYWPLVEAVNDIGDVYFLHREIIAHNFSSPDLINTLAASCGFAPALKDMLIRHHGYVGMSIASKALLNARRISWEHRLTLTKHAPKLIDSEEDDLLWCRAKLIADADPNFLSLLDAQLQAEETTYEHLADQLIQLPSDGLIDSALTKLRNHGYLSNVVGMDSSSHENEDINDNNNPLVQPYMVSVFSMDDVLVVERNGDGKYNTTDNIGPVIKQLKSAQPLKPLASIPSEWGLWISETERLFPNFCEVITIIKRSFAVNTLGHGGATISPILMLGPPGTGKTTFARHLASYLNTSSLVIDMASAQTNYTLSGSERMWSNAMPGTLFKTLALGSTANPIVVLDEIDKVGGHESYDPCSALYTLLERDSAKCFSDLCLPDIPLDASHILWMATANDIATIPYPLLSRFVVVQVPLPTREQSMSIAHEIYRSMRSSADWGHFFDEELTDNVINVLAELSPRRMRLGIEQAFGAAAIERRRTLLPKDIPNLQDGRRHIGFV